MIQIDGKLEYWNVGIMSSHRGSTAEPRIEDGGSRMANRAEERFGIEPHI